MAATPYAKEPIGMFARPPGTWLLPAAAMLIATPALADDDLKVSGSVRLRYEAIEGQPRAGFGDSDQLVNLRTIVLAQYRVKPLTFVAELYDSRVWGDNPRTPISTGEVNALELVQAYVAADLGPLLGAGSKASLQAGRFKLDLGSRRLIAVDDYRNTTSAFTGLRLDIANKHGAKATFYYTLPQVRLPDDYTGLHNARVKWDRESFDQVTWGGIVSAPLKGSRAKVDSAFVHFGERDAPGRPTRDRSLNSVTARIFSDPAPGKFDYEAEVIYQWGTTSTSLAATAAHVPVSATFFRGRVGYSFPGSWKPRLAFEFDRASGDGKGSTFSRFDPLFGMRRADLGPAGLYNAIGRSNIVAPGVRIEVAPSKRIDAFATYKPMWLASRLDGLSTTGVRDASGNSGSFAGHQFDARARYWLLPKRVQLEADGVLLLNGRFLETAPNAPHNGDTRYVVLNLTGFF